MVFYGDIFDNLRYKYYLSDSNAVKINIIKLLDIRNES